MPSPEWEIRTSSGGLSVEDKRIRGYAIVFDSLSEDLGGFREVIAPDAVDRTLRKALDVRALVDHDSSKILGRTKAGTLTLRKDGHGLKAEIVPPEYDHGARHSGVGRAGRCDRHVVRVQDA